MSESELERLAELVAEKVVRMRDACSLTPEEQASIRELLGTKKRAVRYFFYTIGAVFLWIMKEAVIEIWRHISIR